MHRFLHITELSHVQPASGDRPGRPVRTAEDDRRRVGRRQERLPRRDDQPAGRLRRAGARRLRDHRERLPPLPGPRGPGQAHRRSPVDAEHRRRAGARRSRHADPPLDRVDAVPGRSGCRDPHRIRAPGGVVERRLLCGALLGHRRRPARRVVRRPAGDLPERRRHRRGAGQDEGGVREPLQRPRDQLPRPQGLRAQPTWRCPPACSAWCAPTSAPPA